MIPARNRLAQLLLIVWRMTKTSFITETRSGVDMISTKLELLEKAERVSWIDGVLIVTFMASFLGLVCLLAN